MNVAGIILAAGASTRFKDGHKLLVVIDGVPIVRRVALMLAASSLSDIVLIVPSTSGLIATAAGHGRWRAIENPNSVAGLSSSLRMGLHAVARTCDGILVALADMPGVSQALVEALISKFIESRGQAIVFPQAANGRQGHPVIWPRSLFGELEAISGDAGGKSVLIAHPELWQPLRTDDAGPFVDIDTRDDLDTVLKS